MCVCEYTVVGSIICVYALETGLQAAGVRRPPPRLSSSSCAMDVAAAGILQRVLNLYYRRVLHLYRLPENPLVRDHRHSPAVALYTDSGSIGLETNLSRPNLDYRFGFRSRTIEKVIWYIIVLIIIIIIIITTETQRRFIIYILSHTRTHTHTPTGLSRWSRPTRIKRPSVHRPAPHSSCTPNRTYLRNRSTSTRRFAEDFSFGKQTTHDDNDVQQEFGFADGVHVGRHGVLSGARHRWMSGVRFAPRLRYEQSKHASGFRYLISDDFRHWKRSSDRCRRYTPNARH